MPATKPLPDDGGALERFYADRPERLSDEDLLALVERCRAERERWLAAKERKAVKAAAAITMVTDGEGEDA